MVKQVGKKQPCCELLNRELAVQLQISGTHKFTMGKNRGLAASVLLMATDVFAFCASSSFSSAAGETQSLSHSWSTSHCFFCLGCLKVGIYTRTDVTLPSTASKRSCHWQHWATADSPTAEEATKSRSQLLLCYSSNRCWLEMQDVCGVTSPAPQT